MRVVLDTNVFVAGYFNRGSASARILDLCSKNEYELVISTRLRREVDSILKNIRVKEEYLEWLRELFTKALQIKPAKRVFAIREDPDDNKFLECAFEGKADYLITSDKHLLELGEFAQTKICKPTQFLKLQRVW